VEGCEIIFRSAPEQQRHYDTFHSSTPNRICCNICSKTFSKMAEFLVHQYQHTLIKPYKWVNKFLSSNFLFSKCLKIFWIGATLKVVRSVSCYLVNWKFMLKRIARNGTLVMLKVGIFKNWFWDFFNDNYLPILLLSGLISGCEKQFSHWRLLRNHAAIDHRNSKSIFFLIYITKL